MQLELPAAALLATLHLACLATGTLRSAQDVDQEATEGRVLDHSDYARWNEIRGSRLSWHGTWLLYELAPGDAGDGKLLLHGLEGDQEYVVERGQGGRFDADEAFAVCKLSPARDEVRVAQKEKKKDDAKPKAGLAIVKLASGEVEVVERVKSFALSEERGGWVAWLHEKAPKPDKKDGEEEEAEEAEAQPEEAAPAVELEPEPEPGIEPAPEQEPEEKEEEDDKKKKDRKDGTELVLRHVASGEELRFEKVLDYAFSDRGSWFAFATSTKDASGDGLHVVSLEDRTHRELLTGPGHYTRLVFDEDGGRLAFLSDRDDYEDEAPDWSLYLWDAGAETARVVAGPGIAGLPEGWAASEHRSPRFSRTGRRVYFGSAAAPEPDPEEPFEDEKVVVDVWSWTDGDIQPVQLKDRKEELERSYLAVAHLDRGDRVVQLATPDMPNLDLSDDGEIDLALGTSDLPYRRMVSWDTQNFRDAWLVDVTTGARSVVFERERWRPQLSPAGRFLTWWDAERRAWFVWPTSGGEPRDLTSSLDVRFDNELHDAPSLPRSYGSAGWTLGDGAFLVYDRHDVWRLDPTGARPAALVTDGAGREHDRRYRVVDLDRDEEALDPSQPLLLETFDYTSKAGGFSRDAVDGSEPPVELLMLARDFSTPVKADEADVLRFTRSSFREFPDLWVSGLDLSSPRRVSEANPQQAEYLWGTAELVRWRSSNGQELEGLLYRPDDFDPTLEYPLLTYFYERNSDNLHRYQPPTPHRSTIRIPFYTSRGYCVFVPDIPYEIGYPGQSAVHAVLSGVNHVLSLGFVDERALGVQGHSWGGYQIAYLVTQTDLFAAAIAGAPVSNMISAYGGIRLESGMSRQFQYEKTQSRIGGTLWEKTQRYIDNSPVFYADRVDTPLLMLHNDLDGAVPWHQGVEMFMALRRLDKPVWLLNYNGQPHWVTTTATQRDYATRMQQFFDHYLKGAPPPRWMVEGIPAVDKGRTLGLELVEPESLDR